MAQLYRQISYYCCDCYTLLNTIEDKVNSAICSDCYNIVCADCVHVDHDAYLCEACMNMRLAKEDDFE
jgi:hypothetical protein